MHVSDPRAIRALAHPIRLDLLELLAATGPATAASCGRILGLSQASCSFHLRQLAKYGFVEDAGPGRDKRERLWRVTSPQLTVRLGSSGDAVVRQQLERLVVEREMAAILGYVDRRDGDFADWQHKAGIVTSVLALSAGEAAEIKEKWKALLEPYVARTVASGLRPGLGQRYVRYLMAATPLAHNAPGDASHD